MSNLPQDLITFITGTTAVTGLVGGSAAPRVHYSQVPQTSQPSWIWLAITSDTQIFTMDESAGIHEAFVDIECVASGESGAQTLSDAVTARLDGYKGTAGNSVVRGAWLSDKDDSYIPKSVTNQDSGRNVVSTDLRLFYST
jgi:hypothetical protein